MTFIRQFLPTLMEIKPDHTICSRHLASWAPCAVRMV